MTDIPKGLATKAVQAFLDSQFNKKTEKEQKQLAKAKENNDHAKIASLQEKLSTERQKYHPSAWLDKAANQMAKQLHFGTHISKGIHPDAKGDNVSFQANYTLAPEIVGTHSINSQYLDANGNAAALPLAAFFDFVIGEVNDSLIKIRDLIVSDNADFIASLSTDKTTAEAYQQAFKAALQNTLTEPVSHERNKQMLWPINAEESDDLETLHYHNIVPLYPSVLTHEFYQRINTIKYSDDNKQARENRFKKTAEQKSYVTLSDLASMQLGGTKPQNVSLLMSKQGGRNYLLPSMPPIISKSYDFKLSKFADSFFGKSLIYHCYQSLQQFDNVIKNKKNSVDIRDDRKLAIDEMLHTIFSIAKQIQTTYSAGWSSDYRLNYSQKLWLDPRRADLEGEEDFANDREQLDWYLDINRQFADWLNKLIRKKFPDIKHDIGDSEHTEWQREIEEMSKHYERAGKGVFL